MSNYFKTSLPLVTEDQGDARASKVLNQAKQALGFIPNMYASMANAPLLLESYMTTYSSFRANAAFSPVEQEIIFLVISRQNECHYCMAAHSFVADNMTKVPASITNAIRDGREIEDAKLAALVRFVTEMVESRGRPIEKAAREFMNAGYSEKHMLEVVLAIAIKTMSNYANHLTNPPVDEVFSSRVWSNK